MGIASIDSPTPPATTAGGVVKSLHFQQSLNTIGIMAANNLWEAIREYEQVLKSNSGGAEISRALQDFGPRVITPLISEVTSLDDLDKKLDFFRTHLGHATYHVGNHPEWARDHYPTEVIHYAEDELFDSVLFPLAFPRRNPTGRYLPEHVWLSGLSSFPRLISDYLRVSPTAYRRIIEGTTKINSAVASAQAYQSREGLVGDLEQISGKYNDEGDRENKAKDDKITSGMNRIAAGNASRLMKGVQFSDQYRTRLRLLEERLAKATDGFNRHAFRLDDVRSDFQRGWTNYVVEEVRKSFLTDVFDRAYGTSRTALVTPNLRQ